MHIYVGDVQYVVAIKWEMDDTIRHFTEIDGERIELSLVFEKAKSAEVSVTAAQVRTMLEEEITKLHNDRFGNWRT